MNIKPIRTSVDYAAALKEVERLWDKAQPGTRDGDKFEVLSALVDATSGCTLGFRHPTRSKPSASVWSKRGSRRRTCCRSSKRAPARTRSWPRSGGSISQMIRRLHARLSIPIECLVQDYKLKGAGTGARPRHR
jgi:hypothetical protein